MTTIDGGSRYPHQLNVFLSQREIYRGKGSKIVCVYARERLHPEGPSRRRRVWEEEKTSNTMGVVLRVFLWQHFPESPVCC